MLIKLKNIAVGCDCYDANIRLNLLIIKYRRKFLIACADTVLKSHSLNILKFYEEIECVGCQYKFELFACCFLNFGVKPMKNSKFIPGIGRESTER